MPIRFTSRILGHLANTWYQPSPTAALARDLRVEAGDRDLFRRALDRLAEEGSIVISDDGLVGLPPLPDEVTGTLRLNPRGFGFVVTDRRYREGDLFVPPGSMRDAITGDRVRVAVVRQPWRAKAQAGRSGVVGRVLEVVERGQEQFVGVLQQRGRQWVVVPDGRSLHEPVVIRDPRAKNAKAGDKVVIELLHYPEDEDRAEGVITRVLGEAGRPDVETQAVIEAHGLRDEFPPAVQHAAREASARFEALSREAGTSREDLTQEFIFTIDPPDAKDFDDAISIEHDAGRDEWTLGVHIADVSSFVRPGEPLDDEARARGTSVYLPRLVLPMLPEVLSNGVCSLQEGVDRLTKSVFITFDARGGVLRQRAAATVIRSRKRLTYIEAQALIDGDLKAARAHAAAETDWPDGLVEALRRSDRLARILQARRLRDGMIVLNLPEVELVFDDDGHVTDAVPEDDAFTHKLIEMFMVEANEAVARLFDGLGVPILRRIHPDPTFGDIEELRMYARAAQQHLPENVTRHDLQRILEATQATPAARAIHFAVLRTLTKATYSPALIGHFALASDHYAHFTSPIRRYPDLLVHRALEAYLDATENGLALPGGRNREALGQRLLEDERVPDEGALIELGRHCSDAEQEAEQAERALRDFLVMQFLHEHHLGAEFPGVVTGVTSAGVFVSIERFLVEGLCRMSDLPESMAKADRWRVDAASGRLVAQRSGASLGVGDVVTVRVVQVDLASRRLDLMLTALPERPAAAAAEGGRRERVGSRRGEGGPAGKPAGKRAGKRAGQAGAKGGTKGGSNKPPRRSRRGR